ncbi:MAG: hypothetical protein JW841_03350, partial [Deltaproteobacteria bacterium]|nr:hypothetical protein [Deltaproteobacteria bacterium]
MFTLLDYRFRLPSVVALILTFSSGTTVCSLKAQTKPTSKDKWVLVHEAAVAAEKKDKVFFSVNNAGFINEKQGIAVCHPAEIIITNNGGKTWRQAKLPLTNGAFVSFEIVDNEYLWAGGGNTLRISEDGGSNWQELIEYGGVHSSGNYFSFINSKIGWYAIGKENGT